MGPLSAGAVRSTRPRPGRAPFEGSTSRSAIPRPVGCGLWERGLDSPGVPVLLIVGYSGESVKPPS